jgi:hypothetical protein
MVVQNAIEPPIRALRTIEETPSASERALAPSAIALPTTIAFSTFAALKPPRMLRTLIEPYELVDNGSLHGATKKAAGVRELRSYNCFNVHPQAGGPSAAYQLAVATLQADPEAMAVLGPPVETGLPQGSVETTDPSGSAELAIPIDGTKTGGMLYVVATKDVGRWVIERAELEIEGRAERIDLQR